MPVREIRLHGRGGQGTVKASEIIVHAAVRQGMYANSIPYFGFERRGAPVSAFVRISDGPIRPKTQVYRPHCVVVLDETLMNAVNVFEGMLPGAVLVVNSKRPAHVLSVPAQVRSIAVVDATGLALEMLGRPVPNTIMLGAFCRATGWVDLEDVAGRAAEVFGDKNALAVRKGYEMTAVLQVGGPACTAARASATSQDAGARPGSTAASARPGGVAQVAGCEREVAVAVGEAPVGTELYVIRTGDWRSHRPVFDPSTCNGCGLCVIHCPVGAISYGEGRKAVVELTYCKGCGICVRECRRQAISMVEEGVREQ